MHNMFPSKELHITECDSGAWNPSFGEVLISDMNNVYIGGALNWVQSVTMWNLALDENHGPTCNGWACCKGCRPLVTVPSSAMVADDITKTVEYYAMAHLSSHVLPGAKRVGVTLNNTPSSIEAVAFLIPSTQRVVLVVGNTGNADITTTFRIGQRDEYSFELPPGVATISWHPGELQGSPCYIATSFLDQMCLNSRLNVVAILGVVFLFVVTCGVCGRLARKRSNKDESCTSPNSADSYHALPGIVSTPSLGA